MAAELIGGAFLSVTLQVAFERLTSHDITNYFRSRKLEDGLLKKLHITLISINQVLEDAEEMQYRKPNVKQWLDELKDAVYKADDLLDEIATEAEKHKLEAEIQTTGTKVRSFFTAFVNLFDKEIESRVKEVLDNLDYLAKQKDVLGLKEGCIARSEVVIGGKKRLPTTSFVDESSMYGRDGDKEKLINFLLSDDVCTKQPHVISIVGMGGMGKTSLAQLLYNDKRMEDQFQLKAWVCVSEDFDVVRVTKLILQAFHCSVEESKDFNILQHELKERLIGKKFLLVLDDVWNESSTSWEALQVPFNYGALGSKILVTTRSEKVASVMRCTQTHHLKQLEEEDSWKLFTNHAFSDKDAVTYANLESLGRKIVEKCKGLPLAIKTLGSLLQTKLSHKEWVKIFKSDIWHLSENQSDVIPALRLSYHYLPSNLKRCFAYCCIFPKDYEINKDLLIQLWMAEGLLVTCERDKCAEEMGNEFLNDLQSRSFFQQSGGDGCHFVMHDLLNDLAKSVSGEFCSRLEGDWVQDIPKKARHFSYLDTQRAYCKMLEPIYKCDQLHSFISILKDPPNRLRYIYSKVTHDLTSRLKYLRVLSLCGYWGVIELPSDVSNLKHLRYLDLSATDIQKLPDSICELINLQTLKLELCYSLIELPSELHKLINLHHLVFHGTNIKNTPLHLGRLKHLRTLTSFFVGKHTGSNIKELGKLKNLQGRLSIFDLQNVTDPMDAMEANMRDKDLDELALEWSKENDESEIQRCVLDALQPDSNLKSLTIRGYGGTRFPDWFGPHYLSNLVSLQLMDSKYCFFLPPLGQLASLKEVCISGFGGMEVIGSEFYGNISSNVPFRCLEILRLKNMMEWEEWICFDGDNEGKGFPFPCLQELSISQCPKLKKGLPRQLPSLKILVIEDCQELEASLPKANALGELKLQKCEKILPKDVSSNLKLVDICGNCAVQSFLEQLVVTNANLERMEIADFFCPNLKKFPNSIHCYNSLRSLGITLCHSIIPFSIDLFPNLVSLYLDNCPNLDAFPVSAGNNPYIMSLNEVTILNCPKLVSFPDGGLSAPKLEHMHLEGLTSLKSLPENMHTLLPSLKSLTLLDCTELESLPQGGLPSSLTFFMINGCPKLIASRKEWSLQNLHSLRCFRISDDFENVESFPEESLLPPNLGYLVLEECSNLKSLNYRGLLLLKSLKHIWFRDCPNLQCLPEEGLPNSLTELAISGNCPLLKQRCQKEKGKDWHKISHISGILIDNVLS